MGRNTLQNEKDFPKMMCINLPVMLLPFIFGYCLSKTSATCNGDASEDDAVKQHIQDKEMQLQLVEHARWLQREKKAHEEWLKKKWLEEQEKKRQEEQDVIVFSFFFSFHLLF